MSDCVNVDESAGLVRPCDSAPDDTIKHWCWPCVNRHIETLRAENLHQRMWLIEQAGLNNTEGTFDDLYAEARKRFDGIYYADIIEERGVRQQAEHALLALAPLVKEAGTVTRWQMLGFRWKPDVDALRAALASIPAETLERIKGRAPIFPAVPPSG